MHTEVRFVEPVSESLKEENGGGLTSSSFGQLRCRKSQLGVFGRPESIGTIFTGHLKTSSAVFHH
jgi:hypothetical protein